MEIHKRLRKILYAPITPVWAWYMLRSGAVWFFTPSNPKLTFGGMEGEPKKEMYALLPPELYPTTFNALPEQDFSEIKSAFEQSGISYPFIVKPEIGCQGILLRKIDNEDAWKNKKVTPASILIVLMKPLGPALQLSLRPAPSAIP